MPPFEILLVEDNPGDVRLTREALRDSRIDNHLSVVNDGEAAIGFLARKGTYGSAPVPDLILLDLNLPKLNGLEVLKWIKSNDHLRIVPVVILTTSASERDIREGYSGHANCYITKPIGYEAFIEVIRSIEDLWLTIVKLPNIK